MPVILGVSLSMFFLVVILVTAYLTVKIRMSKKRQVLPNEIALGDNDSTSSAVTMTREQKNDDKTFHTEQNKSGSATNLTET